MDKATIIINNITTAQGICTVLDLSQAEYPTSEAIINDIEGEPETCLNSFDIDAAASQH